MDTKPELFWTLDDYKRFLQHPAYEVRQWALERIETQYPRQAAENVAVLLKDPETILSSKAARIIGDSEDARYEPLLLDALPRSKGSTKRNIFAALGKLRSTAILPQIIAELDEVDVQNMRGARHYEVVGMIEALGYYRSKEARAALWRFIERYPHDDSVAYAAFNSLLNSPDIDTIPRLVERYLQLDYPGHMPWQTAPISLAAAAGVSRPADEVKATMHQGPEDVLWTLEYWLGKTLVLSENFINAFFNAAYQKYQGLLPYIITEIIITMERRGDDLAGWEGAWMMGGRPKGYRWRNLYAYKLVSAFADNPPTDSRRYAEVLGMSLALMAQVGIDEDDETKLRGAQDEDARREVLLEIIGSPRLNVMPDIVERVVALGPDVVPDLTYLLDENNFWAALRAVRALTKIAREHPGVADPAIPAILDLMMHGDQSDYMMETTMAALQAIGPAVIEPAAARLGQGDMSYDIYVSGALCEIPTEAALDAIMKLHSQEAGDEGAFYNFTNLGHRRGFEMLKEQYEPNVRGLDEALYTLGLLNDYEGDEMEEWRVVAQEGREQLDKLLETDPAQLFHELITSFEKSEEDKPKQDKPKRRKRKKK